MLEEDIKSLINVEKLAKMMEEMANAPREKEWVRQPGEKCMYEIQRKENLTNGRSKRN